MKLLDVVILLEDIVSEGLNQGQTGTIVEEYKSYRPKAFEVEFCDATGRTLALVALSEYQIAPIRVE